MKTQNKTMENCSYLNHKIKFIICTLMIMIIASLSLSGNSAMAAVKQSRTSAVIGVGETVKFSPGSKNKVRWVSNNNKVASVNKNGTVKGISVGEAVIRAYVNSTKILTFMVTVDDPKLNTEEISLMLGEEYQLEIFGTDRDFKYYSNDSNIVEMDGNTIHAIDLGTTEVIVYNGSSELVCTVTVTDEYFPTFK